MKTASVGVRVVVAVGLPLMLAALGLPTVVAAQTAAYARTAVDVRTSTPVVAASLRIPAGSEQDPNGLEGMASTVGAAILAQARARLDGTARVDVHVQRSYTTFRLTTTPDAWATALAALEYVVFVAPLEASRVTAARNALAAQLRFMAASPGLDFERRAAELLAEPGHPWARPIEGYEPTVTAIDPAAAERFRADRYRPQDAVLAVVGAVDSTWAPPPTDSAAATPPPASGLAWSEPMRLVETQEVTSTWIAAAAPLPADRDRTTLELATAFVADALSASGLDPARYAFETRLAETPAGPVVEVEAVVAPEAADRIEAEIRDVLAGRGAIQGGQDFFTWERRRFRARTLLADADPLRAADRIAGDLLRSGYVRNLTEEIRVLTAEDVAGVIDSIGPLRVFRLEPDLGGGG